MIWKSAMPWPPILIRIVKCYFNLSVILDTEFVLSKFYLTIYI